LLIRRSARGGGDAGVVYATDNPAPRIVLQRFRCPPSRSISSRHRQRPHCRRRRAAGFVSTRFGFGVGHVATEFQYEGGSRTVSAFSTHLLIRPTPREHIEGGLAIGYRRSVFDDRIQEGLEVGLPHRYALWRDELRTVALEVRPMLLLSSGVEPSLEAAFLIPLAQVMQLRIGGRAYTFEGDLRLGLSTGLQLERSDRPAWTASSLSATTRAYLAARAGYKSRTYLVTSRSCSSPRMRM